MKIKIIMIMIFAVIMTGALFGAGLSGYSADGIKKIAVNDTNIKQLTLEGKNFEAEIIGGTSKNIEIFISKKKYSEDELKNTVLAEDSSFEQASKFTVGDKELNIKFDNKKETGKFITVFTPGNISMIITFESGKIDITGVKGELLLDGKSMDTDIKNVSGVLNYRNKSGDLKIDGFEGVLDIKTYSGNISLKDITGSLSAENTAGEFELNKFDGQMKCSFQVGDIDIRNSKFTGAEIENQSGDIRISDAEGDKITLRASLGGIKIKDSKMKMTVVELNAGELELNDVTSDIDFDMNLGDISLKDFSLLGSQDSNIDINFGEVNLGFKDPSSYNFLRSVKDEKVEYEPGMYIDDDVRICTANNKCLRIETNLGGITVK